MAKGGAPVEIMPAAELKPLLVLSKRQAVCCAIGMTRDKQGLVLLHRRTKPRKLMAELLRQAKAAGADPDRATVRFGQATVDGASDSTTMHFTVNKHAPDALRVKLLERLRPVGFQHCELHVDETLEDESDDDGPDETEISASEPHRADTSLTGDAAPPDAPMAPSPTSARARATEANTDVPSSGAEPDAGTLKAVLRGMTERIRPVLAADPPRGASLLKLAAAARDSLADGDLAAAQSGISRLRQALGEPASSVPLAPGREIGWPGPDDMPANGSPPHPASPPAGRSFMQRTEDFLKDPHTALGAASFAPSLIGSAASAADGLLYAIQGDRVDAGISLGAAVLGTVSDAGAARLVMRGAKEAATVLREAGQVGEVASDAGKAGRTARDTAKIAEEGTAAAVTRAEGDVARGGGSGVASGEGVQLLSPAELRFSQTTAGGGGRAQALRSSMAEHGWSGPPIDAVRTPQGIVAIDNTRVAVAQELGMKNIPVRVRETTEPLPPSMTETSRFGPSRTWGEALAYRTGRQRPPLDPTGTSLPPRLPGGR